MDSTNRRQPEREVQWARAGRDELVERIGWAIRDDGTAEPLAGLRLVRHSAPTPLGHGTSSVAFCVIAQGSKEILLGDNRYRYDPAHYLITTAALPVAVRITEAATAQIASERQQVVAELRREVGGLAVQLASRVVGESLEDDARQRRTVDRFLASLDGAAPTTTGATRL